MSHELVRELAAKRRRALCVVTGVVKTTKPTTVSATLNHSFSANLQDDDDDDDEDSEKVRQ